MRRTRAEAVQDKKAAVKAAAARGEIADSMEYRIELVRRIERGELSPEEGQAELKKVKRNAKRNGLKTREQVFREG